MHCEYNSFLGKTKDGYFVEENSSLTPNQNQDRLISLDRANKMSVLFRKENFINVMKAVELHEIARSNPDRELARKARIDFKNACIKAGLDEHQRRWLWNYLRNYKQRNDWACPGGGW